MNISYDFQLRAAENGHRWTGHHMNVDPVDPKSEVVWRLACACGWTATNRPLHQQSDVMIDWASHVISAVSDQMNTPEGRIRTK